MSSNEAAARLEAELALLEAMFPGNITFNSRSRDLQYTSSESPKATLILRLPEQYPESGFPAVISACDGSKNDIRDKTRRAVEASNIEEACIEVLDQIISAFDDMISQMPSGLPKTLIGEFTDEPRRPDGARADRPESKTVIIWLHHLLATSKRKLAVNPTVTASATGAHSAASSSSNGISGITKPGYPGIMIFSGRSDLVDAHVRELKALNWQAFQIRYDSAEEAGHGNEAGEEWQFSCCKSKIIEVETMAELVQGIVREDNKRTFLNAVGVK